MEKKRLKLAILQFIRDAGKAVNKMNLIGRGYQAGGLEHQLKTAFDNANRAQASLAFEELKINDLIRPTFSDLVDPENWVEITDKGRTALERGDPELEGVKPAGAPKEWDQKFGLVLSPKQAEKDFVLLTTELAAKNLPMSVIFLDIDRFKEFNTKYTETDETLLPAFMGHLRELCAGRGEAYRQGGDEFVVILPNCDLGEARGFAEGRPRSRCHSSDRRR